MSGRDAGRNRRRTEQTSTIKRGKLTSECEYVQGEQDALTAASRRHRKLTKSIREVEAVIETMRTEHDPLVSHIFISRRNYRNVNDTKRKTPRDERPADFNTACSRFRGV